MGIRLVKEREERPFLERHRIGGSGYLPAEIQSSCGKCHFFRREESSCGHRLVVKDAKAGKLKLLKSGRAEVEAKAHCEQYEPEKGE